MSILDDPKKFKDWISGGGPDTPSRYLLWSDKWDNEFARNLLLTFINQRGLDAEFIEFYEKADKILNPPEETNAV